MSRCHLLIIELELLAKLDKSARQVSGEHD